MDYEVLLVWMLPQQEVVIMSQSSFSYSRSPDPDLNRQSPLYRSRYHRRSSLTEAEVRRVRRRVVEAPLRESAVGSVSSPSSSSSCSCFELYSNSQYHLNDLSDLLEGHQWRVYTTYTVRVHPEVCYARVADVLVLFGMGCLTS